MDDENYLIRQLYKFAEGLLGHLQNLSHNNLKYNNIDADSELKEKYNDFTDNYKRLGKKFVDYSINCHSFDKNIINLN